MESFGQYLKKEREAKSISLDEISESTRIRKIFLEALENDDIDNLPADVFVKGFLRSYCNYVGLNATEVIVLYKSFRERNKETEQVVESPKKGKFTLRLSSVLVAIFLVFCISFIFYINRDKEESPQPVESKQTMETIHDEENFLSEKISSRVMEGKLLETDRAEEAPEPPVLEAKIPLNTEENIESEMQLQEEIEPEVQLQEEPKVQIREEKTLKIEASEMTWLRVKLDDNPPFEVTLKTGESADWKALNTFELLIGNAAGINVYYNGEYMGVLGEKGKVVSLSFPRQE